MPMLALTFDKKVAADRHRLEFDVIDVGRNDRAAARDFAHHEFRRDEFWDLAPKLSPSAMVADAFSTAASRARFSRWAT